VPHFLFEYNLPIQKDKRLKQSSDIDQAATQTADAQLGTLDEEELPQSAMVCSPLALEEEISALLNAITNGNSELVMDLLEGGAAVNGGHKGGDTPLIAAASGGSQELVNMLVSRGATVNSGTTTSSFR